MCELGSELIRPVQPVYPVASLLPIPSAVQGAYPNPDLTLLYLTPLESKRFPTLKNKANGITTFQKKEGVGGAGALSMPN